MRNKFLMIKINPMIRIKRISDSRYIELVNFLPTILRARIYYSFVQTFFQIVATIFETMSRCATYAQEIYFYFLEKKKVSITFQRRKLSKKPHWIFLFHSSSRSTGDEKKNEHNDANFLNRHVTTVPSTKIIIKVYIEAEGLTQSNDR